jgi:hypothetical protein
MSPKPLLLRQSMRRGSHVERIDRAWRWSFTHPGGAYPLLRITARFLRMDYHGLVIGFRKIAGSVYVLAEDPAMDKDPDAWIIIDFDGPTTPPDLRDRLMLAVDRR